MMINVQFSESQLVTILSALDAMTNFCNGVDNIAYLAEAKAAILDQTYFGLVSE